MKKPIQLITSLLLLACAATAQTKQDSLDLRRDMNAYKRVSLNIDYDSLVFFMPPAMFAIVPKEDIKEQLRSAFENEIVKIGFDQFEYKNLTPVGKTGEHLYAIVPYDAAMTMTLTDTTDSATVGMVFLAMQMQFGSQNVEQRPDKSMFIKTPDKQMIAIKSPGHDSWKFIEDKRKGEAPGDAQTQELVDRVIPKEVLDATKN